jgi:hypothetical protein
MFIESSEAHRAAVEERLACWPEAARRNLAPAKALQLAAQANVVLGIRKDGAAIALQLAVESLRITPIFQGDQRCAER